MSKDERVRRMELLTGPAVWILGLSPNWPPQPFTDLTPLVPASAQRFMYYVAQTHKQWMNGK